MSEGSESALSINLQTDCVHLQCKFDRNIGLVDIDTLRNDAGICSDGGGVVHEGHASARHWEDHAPAHSTRHLQSGAQVA